MLYVFQEIFRMRQSGGLVLKDIDFSCELGCMNDGWMVDQGGRNIFTFRKVMLGGLFIQILSCSFLGSSCSATRSSCSNPKRDRNLIFELLG